jgi:hypothetical protein
LSFVHAMLPTTIAATARYCVIFFMSCFPFALTIGPITAAVLKGPWESSGKVLECGFSSATARSTPTPAR